MFHLRKFKLKHFEQNAQDPTGCINGWKVYGWCSAESLQSCQLLVRLKQMDALDASQLRQGMTKLMHYACVGKPLQVMYDEKKCHEALSYNRPTSGVEHKVYRIWPGGNVRLYFSYGSDKSIIVFYGLSKRKDKLSAAESNELSQICESFLMAQEQHQLKILKEEL